MSDPRRHCRAKRSCSCHTYTLSGKCRQWGSHAFRKRENWLSSRDILEDLPKYRARNRI
jgi:hypothetical protein